MQKHIVVLVCLIGLTMGLAGYNSWDEGLDSISMLLFWTIFAASAAGVLATGAYMYSLSRGRWVYCVFAYITTLLGFFSYLYFAFDRQTDPDGSGHMHIIFFPALHGILTLGLLLLIGLAFKVSRLFGKKTLPWE